MDQIFSRFIGISLETECVGEEDEVIAVIHIWKVHSFIVQTANHAFSFNFKV